MEEKKEEISGREEDTEKKEGSFLNKLLGNFFGGGESETISESSDKTQKDVDEKSALPESFSLKNIQMPQPLGGDKS